MKAIAIAPGKSIVKLIERKEPIIHSSDEIKLQILRVGICGTDREEVRGGRAAAPPGEDQLVIGHEMFGRVVEVGKSVSGFEIGDYAALTVRRGCDICLPCLMNRPDMCKTGNYKERGIKELDGYQTEFVVDKEQYAVRIPKELRTVGVLSEPLSVAEKAIDEVWRVQNARLPDASARPAWFHKRKCLVAGLGPIGLLATMALRLRGAEVYGLDIVDEESSRPSWLKAIGGKYIDGRKVTADHIDDRLGAMQVIFEASGVAALQFNLLDALAIDGIYVLTGIPSGNRTLEIPGAELMRKMVLNNQMMLGSVNASRDHFQMAVDDMLQAENRWNGHLEKLITHRYEVNHFNTALNDHPDDEIKTIIEWKRGDLS